MMVKLFRDLRASWSRFVLMVVALTVSLAVFGGMLYAWASISRETSGAYLSTQPASATIVLDQPIDAAAMAAIVAEAHAQPGVVQAAGRAQFDSPVEVNGASRTMPLQVFVAPPDDPMRMVKFDVARPGTWPPAPGEILVGEADLALLDIEVGDTLTIAPPGGTPVRLRVAGTVYDPSLAPSPQEQRGRGYLSSASLATVDRPAQLDQLKIQVADPGQTVASKDRDRVLAVAGDVAAWLQRDHGLTVEEIQVPTPYAHPHQWQSDVLFLSLLAGGAAALLLSGILVATMLNNLFTRQIPQIGIMKAIGARSGPITRLYLAMVLIVAAAATVLALPLAVLIGQNLLQTLLTILGITPVSLVAPWWAHVVILAAGLGLPPLLALIPLLTASRITVRAAIDHHGGASEPSSAAQVLTRLSRVPGLDRGLLMALRNTVRRPARFWLSVGLLASAGTVFVAGMSLNAGTEAVDEQRKAQRYWDVDVDLATPADENAVVRALGQVPGITRTEASTRIPVGVAGPGQPPFTSTYPDQGHGSIALSTVATNAPPEARTILEGRWLQPAETGVIVLSQIVRDKSVSGFGAGDTVALFIDGMPTTWRIVGVVEERDSSRGGVYTTAEGLAAATGRSPQVNELRIVTADHDEATRQTTATAIDRALRAAGIPVGVAASVSRNQAAAEGHSGPVNLVLLSIALPLGVLGAISLASTMGANILERTREFGILHAIGARPATVRRIVTVEGIVLALTSCLVAAGPALALTAVLGAWLGNLFTNAPLPYRVSVPAVGIWLALVILGSILATEAAATRASRITVREALTHL
jgi:putative ABC transport system permease protein